MTYLTQRIIAAGIAITLLALPLMVGAEGHETHRIFFSEDDSARTDNITKYGTVEFSVSDEIASGQILDQETIRFLEDNIWVMDSSAQFADVEDAIDLETIRFLEDNILAYDSLAVLSEVDLNIDPFLGDGSPKLDEQTGPLQVERLPWSGSESE